MKLSHKYVRIGKKQYIESLVLSVISGTHWGVLMDKGGRLYISPLPMET